MEIKKEEYYCYSVGLGSTENYHQFVKNFLIYSFKKLISHANLPFDFYTKNLYNRPEEPAQIHHSWI